MENMRKTSLQKQALTLFDQGLQIFLSDPNTKQGIGPYSKYDPITDRELVVQMCEKYPDAVLEVSVGPIAEIVALGVGVGQWAQNGEATFKKLCEKHGDPKTVSCSGLYSEHYYFFEYDDSFGFDESTGLKMITGIEGLQVLQVDVSGATRKVQNLSAWLEEGTKEAVEQEQEVVPSRGVGSKPEQVESPSSGQQAATVEIAREEGDTPQASSGEGAVVISDPKEVLRKIVIELIASKKEKSDILAQTLEWNRAQGTLLPAQDIVSLVEELGGTTPDEVETLSGEELLFNLAEGTTLFHDDLNESYFFYEGEPFKAPSKNYEAQLQHRYYKKTHQMPKPKELKNVLSILKSQARFEGQKVDLKNRVANKDEAFLYDLRDKRYIRTTDQGWEIIPAFPAFRRFQHQQPQVEPVKGGNPWDVFNFLAIEEPNRLLIMVYLISLFVGRIAHPVLALFGDQGSAKSFFCSVINKLVDPTLTERIIQPKNERDLIQTLRQKYVTVLDNLSKIDTRVSDIFCQVCTGTSISFRQLYTDEGEHIAQFRHVVILNSISLAIVNADLMDRSIILKCHRIKPEDRKPEEELWDAFEKARPGILGGIFDTLVKAMAIYPTIKIEKLPRLADFAKWGYAIAEALGESGDQFIEDFSENVKRQNESVAEKNVLCQTVLQLMSDKDTILKSTGDIHSALKNIAREDAKDATFPKLPHNLRDGLEKLRSTLLEHGVSFEYLDRNSRGIKILFSKPVASDTSSLKAEVKPSILANGVADVPDVPAGELPVVDFDEIPEVVHE